MKKILTIALIGAGCAACAAEFTLKSGVSGVFDWTDGSNYAGGSAPTLKALSAADRDEVVVPDGVTVVVSGEMSSDSLALIDSLARIRPGTGARVVFNVPEDRTMTFDCAVNHSGETSLCRGKLVKEGGGVLYFTAPASRYKYGRHCNAFYVGVDVNAGELRMTDASGVDADVNLGVVNVVAGATWRAPSPGAVYVDGLNGGGVVYTAEPSANYFLRIKGGSSAAPNEFAGEVREPFCLGVQSKAYVNLRGTNSTCNSTFDVEGTHKLADGGRVGIRKFGLLGEPSSIGRQSANGPVASRNGYWLVSLREPDDPIDVCDKTFRTFNADGNGCVTFDGGAVGGLQLTGTLDKHSTGKGHYPVVLTGSNATECVFGLAVQQVGDANYPSGSYSYSIAKRGSGVWRMAFNTANGSWLSGAIAVEEGTLRFDTIAEKNSRSALGTAKDLYGFTPYGHTVGGSALLPTAGDVLPYAIRLGDGTAEHEGNLEYSGAAAATCSTRPLAVGGRGRLTNGTAQDFFFSDVFTVGAGGDVLTLDGDSTSVENRLALVDDRKDPNGGDLTLVKDGAGTWMLSGTNDVHGALEVRAGTLVLDNRYTWYRFVIKATHTYGDPSASAASALSVAADEFGLYDASGARLNLRLAGQTDYSRLAPGEIAYPFIPGGNGVSPNGWTPKSGDGSDAANLCDDTTAVMSEWYYQYGGWYDGSGTFHASGDAVQHWCPEQPTTWTRMTLRLPAAEVRTVAGYDVALSSGISQAKIWSVEASVDGVAWDEVAPTVTKTKPASGNKWVFADRPHVNGCDAVHTNALGVVDMEPFARTAPIDVDRFFANVSSVRVDAGATLRAHADFTAGGLTLDCDAGAGTIDGVKFAPNGTLDVRGFARNVSRATFQYTLVNTKGFENVANWTLTENGAPTTKLSARVENGRVTILRSAMVIIFR